MSCIFGFRPFLKFSSTSLVWEVRQSWLSLGRYYQSLSQVDPLQLKDPCIICQNTFWDTFFVSHIILLSVSNSLQLVWPSWTCWRSGVRSQKLASRCLIPLEVPLASLKQQEKRFKQTKMECFLWNVAVLNIFLFLFRPWGRRRCHGWRSLAQPLLFPISWFYSSRGESHLNVRLYQHGLFRLHQEDSP